MFRSSVFHSGFHSQFRASKERGAGLIEILVGIGLEFAILAGLLSVLMTTSRFSRDEPAIARANEKAQAILDFMVYDFRMLGSGMPLGQSSFQIGNVALGTAPLPLMTNSDQFNAQFRADETGDVTYLAASYTPSASSLSFEVMSTDNFEEGDTVYLSDISEGGSSGLQGVITSVGPSSIAIAAAYLASAGVQFPAGTLVHRVTTITYDSPADGSGVTRDAENGTVLLAPNSSFTLDYLDENGTSLALPLTEAAIADQLAAVRISVEVPVEGNVMKAANHVATAEQVVALRNLLFSR